MEVAGHRPALPEHPLMLSGISVGLAYDPGMRGAVAIVQARMSSTRLPGKSLADVDGEPMLALLLGRLRHAVEIDRIVVATSTDAIDGAIVEVAGELGCETYRGPRDDVLGRFLGAAAKTDGALARVTADCPLVDPAVVDEAIRLFHRTPECAYASNVEPRTYPDGLDVEVVSAEVLAELERTVTSAHDREHVTAAIRRDLARYRTASLVCGDDLGDLRWTVDTHEDLLFVREVVTRLGARRHIAGVDQILDAVRREPSLAGFHGRRG
jgi:spore coat polysaccharide biosynthesis protein SpsF (cytidylyltransferase family)